MILAQDGSEHGRVLEHGRCEEHRNHRFEDAEAWAERFENPARDEWQKPAEVMRALSLSADARVAEIGSATGYFATRIAARGSRISFATHVNKSHAYSLRSLAL